MTKIWKWLKTYWYVPAIILGLMLGEICWPRRRSFAARARAEIYAAEAAAKAKEWEAKLGTERAKTRIEEVYHEEIEKLEATQKREAAELKDDPVALAKFIVRAGSL